MEQRDIKANSFYAKYGKRMLDLCLSVLALVVLSPIFLIIYILEIVFHGYPAIYKTKRPGRDGHIFLLYKFRSMTNDKDINGELLPEDKRLTKFGLFLRKTSIDELPELINILKGDMSIIGPRPLLVEYLPLYSKRHLMRHAIRPGLACVRIMPSDSKTWTWGEQFENDIYYIEHLSFITDIRMLFAIIKEVFKGSDYRASDTRVPFDGTNLSETRSKQEMGVESHFDSIQGKDKYI